MRGCSPCCDFDIQENVCVCERERGTSPFVPVLVYMVVWKGKEGKVSTSLVLLGETPLEWMIMNCKSFPLSI